MSPSQTHEDVGSVREFFNRWEVYKKAVDLNFTHHHEAMAAVAGWLDARGRVGAFLDLGCGDAAFTSKLLSERATDSYTGVDCSPVALGLAEANLSGCAFPGRFVCGDFAEEVVRFGETFDTIFIGLSLHHLPAGDKAGFFRHAFARLSAGGALVIFEPALKAGEPLESFLDRCEEHAETDPCGLTAAERSALVGHIRSCDFPESPAGYGAMAIDAGFREVRILYTDPEELFVVMACGV